MLPGKYTLRVVCLQKCNSHSLGVSKEQKLEFCLAKLDTHQIPLILEASKVVKCRLQAVFLVGSMNKSIDKHPQEHSGFTIPSLIEHFAMFSISKDHK